MTKREIPLLQYDNETKKKIHEETTRLIAIKGFSAVSMRDIAKEVGIKMSSLYYYYESKEDLLNEIFDVFERRYRHYFDWLSSINAKSCSLEEVMDNMFNKEFLEALDPLGCFGMALVLKEQHSYEGARKCVFELFFDHSITCMQADLDKLVANGVIPASDTKMIARLLMISVMASNDLCLHEYMAEKPPFSRLEFLNNLKSFLTTMLKQGVLPSTSS